MAWFFLDKYKKLFLEISVLGKYKDVLAISVLGDIRNFFRNFCFWKNIKTILDFSVECQNFYIQENKRIFTFYLKCAKYSVFKRI